MESKLYESLVKIQAELKAPKGQYNSFGKYKYRSAEDILEAVKPICHTHNTVLTISDTLEYVGDRYYIKATATLHDLNGNNISNTAYAREEESKKGMDGSQITGTASSYARKYAMNGLFAIDDTKDADTDEHANQTKEDAKASKGQIELFKTLLDNDTTKIDAYLQYYKVKTIDELTNEQVNDAVKIIQKKKKENAQTKNNIIFVEDAHIYYVDGVEVPSVTTILSSTLFKGKYSAVPEFVLSRAAQFGSNVHRAIELHDIEGLNDKQLHCVIEYVKLIKRLNIKELAHETLLAYNYDYAGTADLLLEYEGREILADIKTTSKLDLEYLSWQLSMYSLGLDFHGDLYAIWLNKRVAEFHQVERKSKEEIEELLRGITMQFTAHDVIINGKDVVFKTHATPYYLNQITSLKGKLKVTVKEYKETKSQRQNNYAWALFTKISLEQNGSKRAEDVERIYHYVLQKANVECEKLIARVEARESLEKVYSVVLMRGKDLLRGGVIYREFDCYIGISKFDVKQMQDLIDATIDYGVELGIPFAELDSMKGAYDL